MLDTFHWHAAGETVDDLRGLTDQQIVVVHLNDAPRGRHLDELDVRDRELPAVTGVIDLKGFMTTLAEVGYTGPLSAEPTHPRWPDTPDDDAAAQTAAAMREALRMARSR